MGRYEGDNMKDWKSCTNLEKIEIINKAVEEGKGNSSLGRELGINESTIRKFKKNKCIQEGNLFVLRDITNSNTVVIEQVPNEEIPNEINEVKPNNKSEEKSLANTDLDMEKLNVLLNNLDSLLNLIPKHNNCIFRIGENKPVTLRIDAGLYEELKQRAALKNKTISELLNSALEQYFNNMS